MFSLDRKIILLIQMKVVYFKEVRIEAGYKTNPLVRVILKISVFRSNVLRILLTMKMLNVEMGKPLEM